MEDEKSRRQKLTGLFKKYIDLESWNIFSLFRPVLIQWFSYPQIQESHLKSSITCAFCFDSRCLPRQGYSKDWYVRNHLVAGFAKSNSPEVVQDKAPVTRFLLSQSSQLSGMREHLYTTRYCLAIGRPSPHRRNPTLFNEIVVFVFFDVSPHRNKLIVGFNVFTIDSASLQCN